MYLFSRTARIQQTGRVVDKLAYAAELTGVVSQAAGVPIGLHVAQMSPGLGTVVWSIFSEDLATLEAAGDRLAADEVQDFIAARGDGVFADGMDDTLFEVLHDRLGKHWLEWPAPLRRCCPTLGMAGRAPPHARCLLPAARHAGDMSEWAGKFLQAFIPLFVAIDPIGLAAVFLGLGQNMAAAQRQRLANQAVWTGGLVALGFLFLGQSVFKALGISVSDFQIAGGLILFILAAKDLVQSAAEPEKLPEDFGVVPLGMPLIAGPASITTLLVLAQSQAIGLGVTLVALAANLTLVVLALYYSNWLGQKIGQMGLRAISKIIAMLLAAIAVSMIRQGLRT